MFKLRWTTALAGAGATITLALAHIGGWAMGFTIIIGAIAAVLSLTMVIAAIRKFPDE
ncbi:MAG TPA: hypothetical protein VGF29_01610 [Hyphomicrobiaceae bacterium]|jgi:hypothetical protein